MRTQNVVLCYSESNLRLQPFPNTNFQHVYLDKQVKYIYGLYVITTNTVLKYMIGILMRSLVGEIYICTS